MLDIIFASYHTHGAFSPDYSSELPSGDDMESDEAEGIDEWVATPDGRPCYIDTTDMFAHQIPVLLPEGPVSSNKVLAMCHIADGNLAVS